VRDVALRKCEANGTVGAACQWACLGPERSQVWYGLDVVGGAIARETPNLIYIGAEVFLGGSRSVRSGGTGILMKDMYVGDGREVGIARYDTAKGAPVFSQPQCGICGSPWPASRQFCEKCLYERHHAQGKKQRRQKSYKKSDPWR
jgi:hypothetical protein